MTNTTDTKRIQAIIRRAAKFSNLAAAERWASYGTKAQWVMMGDVGQYWVVRPVDAARLERAGYEICNVFTTRNMESFPDA